MMWLTLTKVHIVGRRKVPQLYNYFFFFQFKWTNTRKNFMPLLFLQLFIVWYLDNFFSWVHDFDRFSLHPDSFSFWFNAFFSWYLMKSKGNKQVNRKMFPVTNVFFFFKQQTLHQFGRKIDVSIFDASFSNWSVLKTPASYIINGQRVEGLRWRGIFSRYIHSEGMVRFYHTYYLWFELGNVLFHSRRCS